MRSTRSRRLEQEENKSMNLKKLEAKLIDGDRQAIAKAMTLMESSRVEDRELADKLLLSLSSLKRKSVKLGISGIPGVGKSTFIEGLGQHILSKSTSSKVEGSEDFWSDRRANYFLYHITLAIRTYNLYIFTGGILVFGINQVLRGKSFGRALRCGLGCK